MKNNMEEIDYIIKETLTKEEAKFYESLEEPGLIGQIGGIFKGKLGWLVVVMNIVVIIAFASFIYCLYRFLNTEATNELIKWGLAGFICLMITSMLKVFGWLQMEKNSLLRELKRLEFQISILTSIVQSKNP